MASHDQVRAVLADAQRARVFPSAVAECGDSSHALWTAVVGTRTFDDGTPVNDQTPYDLASLTKAIGTTTIAMSLAYASALSLQERVASPIAEWQGKDRQGVTIADLLEHASGLPARLVDRPPKSRREFEHDICMTRLEYVPRSRSIYSDLGFILFGFIAADRGQASLADQFAKLTPDPSLTYELPHDGKQQAAPTVPLDEDSRRGRILVGEVHDNYAYALGGVAGHAGLFGTAGAVGAFARVVLSAARGAYHGAARFWTLTPRFVERSIVPGSSRALGWDTMLPTSSCGTRMSQSAFGHVGYTGTSLWIDPARDRYYVLLTNRACGGGSLEAMRTVRRDFHDALADV